MELFALILAVCFYRSLRKSLRKMEKEKTCEKVHFSFVYPDIRRSIDEALSIINRTKDVEAGIKAFAAIKSNLAKLADESPCRVSITLLLGDKEICREIELGSSNACDSIKKLENEWIRGFFSEKTDTLMQQSGETSDTALRVDLMREAVKTSYKGLEYLPGDEALKTKVELTKHRLGSLTGVSGREVNQ